ncbi:MAG: TlpA family protein disulfide reductase [Alphaproteobacteria bacterium]|nr:TlpA family protein disulfide reductase [Alphaproteobacteria bacterium]MBU1278241.1 TlpA family protein disulfide reductase [Alphaproteobacteria bacterium]MBU1573316.1 TlpA family protein disulfide reductase [Alphaproteobacteria bacterium]MBU1828499.1 TlpA family protein disulfide reductase [Alphaproteobacteria bacterium]MBU2078768.1 TlpA family protein disulfide reductase [Alphaproteobacteria bacterium]
MLKNLIAATLYTALSLGAIPAAAQDMQSVMELREDSLQKLGFHTDPKEVSALPFTTMDGAEETLADYAGKLVLLNFWATWCAPCRKEMPALDALSAEFGDKGFVVLPIATGHNPTPAIEKFFETAQIRGLTARLDPKGAMARDMGVLGLPVSILISPQGQEIARMTGDADWFSPSAQAIVTELLNEYGLTNNDSAVTH